MNKTVNINLGGMFFHIDEDAYQKLTRYFDAIKRSLSNSNGQDEIIKDIEMRIAELIMEKQTSDKQVIHVKQVDEIIAIMGQPEDYRIEGEEADNANTSFDFAPKKSRKLYRDTEKGMLGGVCTGLGHYFGIDPVWIRIIFVFLLLVYGTGFIPYIVLWAVMPAAVTTAEKLEMTGEPVNISNIERKVREEFENVSEKFRNADYDKMGKQVKTGAERVASNIGEAFSGVFKVIAKILGAIIVVFSAMVSFGLIVALFTVGTTSFFEVPIVKYAESVNYTDFPMWAIIILAFLAIAIPFFFLFILGLKLLVSNLKPIANGVKYSLLAIWIIAIAVLSGWGIKQATETAETGKDVLKQEIALQPTDTLYVKFAYNDYYAKDVDSRSNFELTQDEKGKEVIYSNDVSLEIHKTDEKKPYIQIEKKADGKTLSDAKQRAEKISYGFKVDGNRIVLDNYLLADPASKLRHQRVEIHLYLPEGLLLKPDSSLQNYDYSDNGYFNLHWSGDYLYKVEKEHVKCLTCPPDEVDEYGDVDTNDSIPLMPPSPPSTTVKIDNATLTIEKNGKEEMHKKVKTVDISSKGMTIKTE